MKVFVTLIDKQNQEQRQEIYDGFWTTEKLVYKEESKIVTIYMNYNKIKMVRREPECVITLNFMEGKCLKSLLEIKGMLPLTIETETSLLNINEEKIHICYQTKIEKEIMGSYDLQLEVIK